MPKAHQPKLKEKAKGRNFSVYDSEIEALEKLCVAWKLKTPWDVVRYLVIASPKTGSAKDAFYLPREMP